MNTPVISILIVNYNTSEITCNCIRSVYHNTRRYSFEIIVVDNASKDDSVSRIKGEFPEVLLISSEENLGFSKGNNLACKYAKGELILLLNSDTIVQEGAIDNLAEKMLLSPQDLILGPVLKNSDLSLQRSWFDFPSIFKISMHALDFSRFFVKVFTGVKLLMRSKKGPAFLQNPDEELRPDYLTMACVMMKTSMYLKLAGLEEELFFYHEDCDFGYKAANANIQYRIENTASIIHLGGSSSGFSPFTYIEYHRGLLFIYKRHKKQRDFIILKKVLLACVRIRYIGTFFNRYTSIKKLGVYENAKTAVSGADARKEIRALYKKLIGIIKTY